MPGAKIYQGIVVANAFNFFMAAGQACLIPFLSLYFLYLDLNPLQTGLLLGIKALTGALSSAFWTQCVTTTARRLKFVLVFSQLILVASHLVMVLMPSMKADNRDLFCPPPETWNYPAVGNCSQFDNQSSCSESTVFPGFTEPTGHDTDLDMVTLFPLENDTTTFTETTANNTTNFSSSTFQENLTSSPTNNSSIVILGEAPEESETSLNRSTTPPNRNVVNGHLNPAFQSNNLDDYWQKDNTEYTYSRRKRHAGHEEDENEKPDLPEPYPFAEESDKPFLSRPNPDVLPSADDGKSSSDLENRLKSIQNQVFSAMLVLVVVSELFSSPCEQVSDELYASFLEGNELPMSSRKTTGCWSLLGGSITPWIIVALVDRLPCHVPPSGSHRILFHFWIFTLVHLLTFLFSVCFPSLTSSPPDLSRVPSDAPLSHHRHHNHHHSKKWANLVRGLKLVATNGRTVLGSITIFVVGFVQGVIGTFLPWVIHDLVTDGSEFYIGAAIGLASAGDLASRLFGEWISRKMGHLVAIMFGLLITATRLTLYGFLMRPWMALIGESAHVLGGALVATAVADHPAFKLTSKGIDNENENGSSKKRKHSRGYGSLASFAAAESMSVNSALRLIRTGVGLPVGCCIGGVLANQFGMSMAFWAASGTAVGWCLLFGIFYPCCKTRCGRTSRKKKTTGLASSLLTRHYKRLSKNENDDEDEEEEEDDDDDEYVDEDVSTEEEKADWMARKRAP